MAWFYLILAILLEIAGTTMLKLSDGFTKLAAERRDGRLLCAELRRALTDAETH